MELVCRKMPASYAAINCVELCHRSVCRRKISNANWTGAGKTEVLRRKPSQKMLDYKKPLSKVKTPPLSWSTSSARSSKLTNYNRFRFHPVPLIIGGTAILYLSIHLGYLLVDLYRPIMAPIPRTASTQQDVSSRYDNIATTFDTTVGSNEYWLGITSLRKKLASKAHGDVLEVSIGTGRNLEFYEWDMKGYNGIGLVDARGVIKKGKVTSFTAVDKSAEMLRIAHDKFTKLVPGMTNVRWVMADAAAVGAIPEPPSRPTEMNRKSENKYDTVVQTMGLCSVADPVSLLRNLGECVKEEDGRILLLEHGRGRWEWLNWMLDKSAADHAISFGCWWNRDIQEIVNESGLEVVQIKTPKWWHGGTTWWIELKRPQSGAKVFATGESVKIKTV